MKDNCDICGREVKKTIELVVCDLDMDGFYEYDKVLCKKCAIVEFNRLIKEW